MIGEGEGTLRAGGVFRFGYCTILTFAGELIRRVDSYVVPLQGPAYGSVAASPEEPARRPLGFGTSR